MLITCAAFAQKLRQYQEFCIVYHVNPDGDCIGSAFALAEALQSAGFRCAVCGKDPVPEAYAAAAAGFRQDSVSQPVWLAVDCADRARTGAAYQDKPFTFWIDHHGSGREEAAYELTDPSRSACSELILELIEALEIPVTAQIADRLYLALVTDTNCFRAPCTNQNTFAAAARLAGCGARVSVLGRKYRLLRPEQRMRADAAMLARTHFLYGGRLITAVLTLADLNAAGISSQEDAALESINDFPTQFADMEIGILLREYPTGLTRVSVKTAAGGVSAKEIAAAFGGGGHYHAGGLTAYEDAEALRERMEEYCRRYFAAEPGTLEKAESRK